MSRVKQLIVTEQERMYRSTPSERVALFNPDRTVYVGAVPAGVPVVRAFPFAFDTPNLATGVEIYTPTIDDVLFDAWIEVTELWDGTTPCADVGSFLGEEVGSERGWFRTANNDPVSLEFPDEPHEAYQIGSGSLGNLLIGYNDIGAIRLMTAGTRVAPGKFITDDPVKLFVTVDGTSTGADPESTQGEAILYLVTVTPV